MISLRDSFEFAVGGTPGRATLERAGVGKGRESRELRFEGNMIIFHNKQRFLAFIDAR